MIASFERKPTMARRTAPTCDVPGCYGPRRRFQRLCERCFRKLPGDIRVGIIEAKHQRRTADWNRLRKHAAEFLNITPETALYPHISASEAYRRNAALLGERNEA